MDKLSFSENSWSRWLSVMSLPETLAVPTSRKPKSCQEGYKCRKFRYSVIGGWAQVVGGLFRPVVEAAITKGKNAKKITNTAPASDGTGESNAVMAAANRQYLT